MSLLYRIVYAAHANGTHHKLALDALARVQSANSERWQNLFLKYAKRYLEGSKAPDNTFKDFKNHVLHVRDNYWGGAPEKAEEWYGELLKALRGQAWSDAAYAAGVLSHYYIDPIQPFHTGQTEAENAIHRACEWSINRSYDDLAKLGRERFAQIEVAVPDGEHWLKDMVCQGAEASNCYYEKLIAHYDIHRGAVDPPAGLDQTARAFLAELITYASTGFARILERAFAESGATPPEVSLTAAAFLAMLQMPARWIEKKLTNAEDRALVLNMYHELQATGRVEATLPEDDRTVRNLYETEVAAPRAVKQAAARAERLAKSASVKTAVAVPASAATQKAPPAQIAPEPAPQKAPEPAPQVAAVAESMPIARPAAPRAPALSGSGERPFLKASDDLEAAPSIGPRSAQWFGDIGIFTVGDFLAADPAATAEELRSHDIDAETLSLWQQQAHLVIDVPGLRGTHAQLLTGAGYLDAAALAGATEADLCAAVLRFAASAEGQRVLRQGPPPDVEKIKGWIEAASARVAA
jgi:hypothetical protein